MTKLLTKPTTIVDNCGQALFVAGLTQGTFGNHIYTIILYYNAHKLSIFIKNIVKNTYIKSTKMWLQKSAKKVIIYITKKT